MKLLAILLSSLVLVACGGGTESIGSLPIIKAAAPAPVKKATSVTGGNGVVIHMYQALYGMAPSNALLVDYALQANNDASTFVKNLTDRFSTAGHADLAKLVLDNLGVTPTTVPAINVKGESEYGLLLDAVKQLFAAYPTMRGQVIMNMTNLLAGLESDATYGAAAVSYNYHASANFTYSSNPSNRVSSLTTPSSGLNQRFATLEWATDGHNENMDDPTMRRLIDHLKQVGYTGVKFDCYVGVSPTGVLIDSVVTSHKYDRMLQMMTYANSIGLNIGFLSRFNHAGTSIPIDPFTVTDQFDPKTFLLSLRQYYAELSSTLQEQRVVLLYLGSDMQQLITTEYHQQWSDIVETVRSNYKGTITYDAIFGGNYWGPNNNGVHSYWFNKVGIWDLMDVIGVVFVPAMSRTPIYDPVQIIGQLFSGSSIGNNFATDLIKLSRQYDKQLVISGIHAWNWDQSLQFIDADGRSMLAGTYVYDPILQATVYRALLEFVNNNLSQYASGYAISYYPPWVYQTWPDGSQSESDLLQANARKVTQSLAGPTTDFTGTLAEEVISTYLRQPSTYHAINTVQGGAGHDIINTSGGNNTIYLNGGNDEVNAGGGDDQIVVSPLRWVKIGFHAYFTDASAQTIEVFLGNKKIGSSSVFGDARRLALNPTGYWGDERTLMIPFSEISDLSNVKISSPNSGELIQILNVNIYSLSKYSLDPASALHTVTASWSHPDWIITGDVMTYDLTKLNLSHESGNLSERFTSIDGGGGTDTIEFDPPQRGDYFQISKVNGLTVVVDPNGLYPEVRLKNVEWIKFLDGRVAVQ